MTDLDALVDTLLYEGYALYPYTPGATKNATPTPFGIVYPPAYARGQRRDVRPRCGSSACCDRAPTRVRGEVRFLQARGAARGEARRVDLAGAGRRSRSTSTGLRGHAPSLDARRRPHDDLRCENHDRGRPRGSTATRRCGTRCSRPTSSARVGRRALRLAARRPQGCEQRQHLAGARHAGRRRGARRRDHAPRPPADRAREPRQPVRLDRDRGGAAAPRARALATRSASRAAAQDPAVRADDRARGARRRRRS